MRARLLTTLAGCYEFVVGDDWRLAVAVAVALGSTSLAANAGLPAWPVTVIAVLTGLIWSTVRMQPHRR